MRGRTLLLAGGAALAVAGSLALLTAAVVRSDRAAREGEAVRLALWRLDARATALVVAEAARAPGDWRSFVPGEDAAGRAVLLPSPLLALPAPPVRLHLLIRPGGMESPQVPPPGRRALAAGLIAPAALAEAEGRLAALRPRLAAAGGFQPLAAALPRLDPRPGGEMPGGTGQAANAVQERAEPAAPAADHGQLAAAAGAERERERGLLAAAPPAATDSAPRPRPGLAGARAAAGPAAASAPAPAAATAMEAKEAGPAITESALMPTRAKAALAPAEPADAAQDLQARAQTVGELQRQALAGNLQNSLVRKAASGTERRAADKREAPGERQLRADLPPDEGGTVVARWLGEDLLLARRLRLDGTEAVGAAVIDWPPLAAELTAAVADLLPAARLRPARAGDATVLAALPVALDPGPLPDAPLAAAARWTLAGAWAAGLGGLAAALAAAWAAHRLAERRAAFVSAVTHELRTPLTALRLHGDLLADPRVGDDPGRRGGAVAAVRGEAARLAHLIDNVLDYARLERRRAPQPRPLPLDELLAPLLPRLRERLAASGLALVAAPAPPALVACDPAAVERILFNLADNAAKYALPADPPQVVLDALIAGGRIELRLRDHGPGLAADVRSRLFHPFSRSAEAAAGSAPGVGLGLALCRRLARAQGGDLRIEEAHGRGCLAVLALPLAG